MEIEPIPYFYESINRNAILVKPKKPFFEWLNKTIQEGDPINSVTESNIYLIREMFSNEEVMAWLKTNFDMVFVNELNDWVIDESVWPQNRTYQMFTKWFDIEVHSMILDLEEFPITKE